MLLRASAQGMLFETGHQALFCSRGSLIGAPRLAQYPLRARCKLRSELGAMIRDVSRDPDTSAYSSTAMRSATSAADLLGEFDPAFIDCVVIGSCLFEFG